MNTWIAGRKPSTTNDRKSVGAKLRKARSKAGMTCREMGAKAGVSGSTIFAYECGRVLPSLTVAVRLAKALRISMDELTEEMG